MINPKPAHQYSSPYKSGKELPKNLPGVLATTKPRRTWKAVVLWVVLFIIASGLSFAYAEYRSIRKNIIVGGEGNSNGLLAYDPTNSSSTIDWSKFQKPGDGRFNVLVLGIGGVNDSGQAHDGTLLTDSIQVISLDTINKKVSFTSVPRDFYYTIPGYGPTKINAVYSHAESVSSGSGGQAARAAIGKVLGINISNFVLVDFTAAQDLINQVGGVDITVPSALYDASFPCDDQIHYCPFSISAGQHHLDGATALKYMRSRHADSDFARSARQQAVISALKAKALSLGTLSNPVTVNNILQTLSTHIKTDLQPSEITQFISIYKSVSPDNTINSVLSTSQSLGLLSNTTLPVTGYVEYPILGYSNYTAIQQWFAKNSPDPFIAKEAATVTLAVSPEATDKQAQAYLQRLKDYGFSVTLTSLPDGVSVPGSTSLYAHSSSTKPVTANYLASLTGVAISSGTPLNSGSDFEIIYVPSAVSAKATSKP